MPPCRFCIKDATDINKFGVCYQCDKVLHEIVREMIDECFNDRLEELREELKNGTSA